MTIILILFGLIIIIFSLYSLLKENYKPASNNFKSLLKDKSDNMDDTQLMVGEMRREFAETILELQKEIISLKEGMGIPVDIIEDEESINNEVHSKPEEENKIHNNFNNIRINDIEGLLKEGRTIEEISEKLDISKGEILLIKDLYLK